MDIHEGFVCESLEYNPCERFIVDMTEKRIKFKKKNNNKNNK